jgi:hypothetical protein
MSLIGPGLTPCTLQQLRLIEPSHSLRSGFDSSESKKLFMRLFLSPKPSSYDSLVVQFGARDQHHLRDWQVDRLGALAPVASEPVLNDELTEALWRDRPPTKGLNTADGLLEIIENAWRSWLQEKGKSIVRWHRRRARRLCDPLQVLCFPSTSPTLGRPGACRHRARHAG